MYFGSAELPHEKSCSIYLITANFSWDLSEPMLDAVDVKIHALETHLKEVFGNSYSIMKHWKILVSPHIFMVCSWEHVHFWNWPQVARNKQLHIALTTLLRICNIYPVNSWSKVILISLHVSASLPSRTCASTATGWRASPPRCSPGPRRCKTCNCKTT